VIETWADQIATDIEEELSVVPQKFALSQNYPNPFNPTTTIRFSVPMSGNYSLRVYNLLGQEIATLLNGPVSAGIHFVNFDASRLSSGIYFYNFSGNNFNQTKKMMLLK